MANTELERFLFWKSSFVWFDWLALGLMIVWLAVFIWRLWWRYVKAPRCPGCRARLLQQADLVMVSGRCGRCGGETIEDHAAESSLPAGGWLTREKILELEKRRVRRSQTASVGALVWLFLSIVVFPRLLVMETDAEEACLVWVVVTVSLLILWIGNRGTLACPSCGEKLDARRARKYSRMNLSWLTGRCRICGVPVAEPAPGRALSAGASLVPYQTLSELIRLRYRQKTWFSFWLTGLACLVPVLLITDFFVLVVMLVPIAAGLWLWFSILSWLVARKCPCCDRLLAGKLLDLAMATGRCGHCGGQVVAER